MTRPALLFAVWKLAVRSTVCFLCRQSLAVATRGVPLEQGPLSPRRFHMIITLLEATCFLCVAGLQSQPYAAFSLPLPDTWQIHASLFERQNGSRPFSSSLGRWEPP